MGELDDYSHVIEDSTYLTSQVILPIYFSYGIIIWLAIAAIWACQCFKSDTQKVHTLDHPQKRDRNSCKQILFQQQKRPKPNTKRTNNVRSLSELSDGTNNRLNERFNKAEAIEERSSRGTNESPLVKKSALPKSPSAGHHHHRHQSSGGSIYFLADMVSQACIKKIYYLYRMGIF